MVAKYFLPADPDLVENHSALYIIKLVTFKSQHVTATSLEKSTFVVDENTVTKPKLLFGLQNQLWG